MRAVFTCQAAQYSAATNSREVWELKDPVSLGFVFHTAGMVLHSSHKIQYKRDTGLEIAELTAVRFVFRIFFTLDNWKDKSAETGGRRETFLNLKDENREKVTVKEEGNHHFLGPGRVSEIFCN